MRAMIHDKSDNYGVSQDPVQNRQRRMKRCGRIISASFVLSNLKVGEQLFMDCAYLRFVQQLAINLIFWVAPTTLRSVVNSNEGIDARRYKL